jgi:superfamily II DNA or RNA helicase
MQVLFDFDSVSRKPQIISECLNEIREHFSVEDKALVFLKRRTRRHMPVRKYAITNKGYFEIFFFETICREIKSKFPSVTLKITQEFSSHIQTNTISENPIQLNLTPRDYQEESARIALQKGNGVIVLPTSAGKTLVVALISLTCVQQKNFNVLVLVPDIQLVQQTYQDFLNYGVSESYISKWTGSNLFSPTKIVIANSQILLSKKQDLSVLNSFEVVIVDECHKMASAEKISKLVKSIKCKHIFGFTGSLPENYFDVWSINRIFGSILYQKKSIELRQDKFISKVRVAAIELTYKDIPRFTRPSMSDPTAGYEEETNWLHSNNFRNSVIAKISNKLETNTLILVDRIVHGEILLEYLKHKTDKQIFFIQGSVEVEEREKMRALMEEMSGVICIAISKIFSTGISIKNLHNIIFASIGKARIKIIQSIGRSLRLHHTKSIATIFDIADICLFYGERHFHERMKLYDAEKIPVTHTTLTEV